MDNTQAMFTAQQMQYNKMYGIDPSRSVEHFFNVSSNYCQNSYKFAKPV